MNIKKGDNIILITGKGKGSKGTVRSISGERVIVDGINMRKFHIKPKSKSEKGSIVEREASVHVSNVMLFDATSGKGTRVGKKIVNGKNVRFAKKSGEQLKS